MGFLGEMAFKGLQVRFQCESVFTGFMEVAEGLRDEIKGKKVTRSFLCSCLQQHNGRSQWKFSGGLNMFALRAFIHHGSKPVALTRQLLENAKSSRMAKFIAMYPVGTINHHSKIIKGIFLITCI